MTEKAPVFDKIRKDYLHQVALIKNKKGICVSLGITVTDDGYKIPFINRTYTVTPDKKLLMQTEKLSVMLLQSSFVNTYSSVPIYHQKTPAW